MVSMKAYAKLNLTLDVTGVRADGYHLLSTVMTSISLYDTVDIEPASNGEIVIVSDVALPEKNTLATAAMAMRDITGRGARIKLIKRIPSEAGMGGASADAAAVLKGMRKLYAPELKDDALMELGLKIGADVPFCLTGGLALCEGIGEVITPLPFRRMDFVIVKPDAGMSTARLFSELELDRSHNASNTACKAIRLNNLSALARCVSNDLECACEKHVGEVGELCGSLIGLGADASSMTGSGTAVFGLFISDTLGAHRAARTLAEKGFWAAAVTSVPNGIALI